MPRPRPLGSKTETVLMSKITAVDLNQNHLDANSTRLLAEVMRYLDRLLDQHGSHVNINVSAHIVHGQICDLADGQVGRWWELHQEIEDKRVADLRDAALAKLTAEERAALGFGPGA